MVFELWTKLKDVTAVDQSMLLLIMIVFLWVKNISKYHLLFKIIVNLQIQSWQSWLFWTFLCD